MADENKTKRRLLSRWEVFFLIVVVFLILYVILRQFGIDMVEVTDDSQIIEHPHR